MVDCLGFPFVSHRNSTARPLRCTSLRRWADGVSTESRTDLHDSVLLRGYGIVLWSFPKNTWSGAWCELFIFLGCNKGCAIFHCGYPIPGLVKCPSSYSRACNVCHLEFETWWWIVPSIISDLNGVRIFLGITWMSITVVPVSTT